MKVVGMNPFNGQSTSCQLFFPEKERCRVSGRVDYTRDQEQATFHGYGSWILFYFFLDMLFKIENFFLWIVLGGTVGKARQTLEVFPIWIGNLLKGRAMMEGSMLRFRPQLQVMLPAFASLIKREDCVASVWVAVCAQC